MSFFSRVAGALSRPAQTVAQAAGSAAGSAVKSGGLASLIRKRRMGPAADAAGQVVQRKGLFRGIKMP